MFDLDPRTQSVLPSPSRRERLLADVWVRLGDCSRIPLCASFFAIVSLTTAEAEEQRHFDDQSIVECLALQGIAARGTQSYRRVCLARDPRAHEIALRNPQVYGGETAESPFPPGAKRRRNSCSLDPFKLRRVV